MADRDERNRGEFSGAPRSWTESAGGDLSGDWARDPYPRDFGGYYARDGVSFRGRGPKNYRRADHRIAEEIHHRLTDDHDVDASNIDVTVDNGDVTLQGTVDSRRTKRIAEEIVYECRGVHDVHNRLKIAADHTRR